MAGYGYSWFRTTNTETPTTPTGDNKHVPHDSGMSVSVLQDQSELVKELQEEVRMLSERRITDCGLHDGPRRAQTDMYSATICGLRERDPIAADAIEAGEAKESTASTAYQYTAAVTDRAAADASALAIWHIHRQSRASDTSLAESRA